jgi:hypothetical protein
MEPRKISAEELEVLRAWLEHDIDGAAALRSQLSADLDVFTSCECGCASIGFLHPEAINSPGVSILDVNAEIVNSEGESVGGMVLFIKSGFLHDVDVHSWFDELPFPTLSQIRWHPQLR